MKARLIGARGKNSLQDSLCYEWTCPRFIQLQERAVEKLQQLYDLTDAGLTVSTSHLRQIDERVDQILRLHLKSSRLRRKMGWSACFLYSRRHTVCHKCRRRDKPGDAHFCCNIGLPELPAAVQPRTISQQAREQRNVYRIKERPNTIPDHFCLCRLSYHEKANHQTHAMHMHHRTLTPNLQAHVKCQRTPGKSTAP
jgi:ribosomal protein L28